jgi:hypothetical protein
MLLVADIASLSEILPEFEKCFCQHHGDVQIVAKSPGEGKYHPTHATQVATIVVMAREDKEVQA